MTVLTKAGLPRQRLRNAPVIARLMFRTEVTDSCWLWQGSTNPKGYGHIRSDMGGPLISVHRVAYEHYVGPIPADREIDHLCGVRHCVNPMHLEVVDRITNVNRGRKNQNYEKTHCVHGHEFTPENTYIHHGKRSCRTCTRENMRRYRA